MIDGFNYVSSIDTNFFELHFGTREKLEAYKKQVEREFHVQEGKTHGIMQKFLCLNIDDVFEVVDGEGEHSP